MREDLTKYRTIADSALEGYWALNSRSEITAVNNTFCRMIGYDESEIIGRQVAEFLDEESCRVLHDRMSKSSGASSRVCDLRFKAKSGEMVWGRVNIATVNNGGDALAESFAFIIDITDLKQAKNPIRDFGGGFREALEHTPLVAMELDVNGNIVFANKYFVELSGWLGEDVAGKSWFDNFVPQDIREELRALHSSIIENRKSGHSHESAIITGAGVRMIAWSHAVIQDSHGNVTGSTGIGIDITDRIRANDALFESGEMLRTVVRNIPVVLWALDTNGIFTLSEGKGLEQLGRAPGEVVGKSVFELYRDFPNILDDCRRALHGESFSSIMELGGRTFDSRLTPIMDAKNQVTGIIGVSADITDRMLAEKKLRDTLTEQKTILENALVAIAFVSNDRRILRVNKKFEEIMKCSREEAIGISVEVFYPSHDSFVEMGKKISHLFSVGMSYQGELELKTWDGKIFWSEVYGNPVDTDDLSKGSIWIFLNISERKLFAESLRESEERARHLSESAFEGIIIHENGAIREVNNGITYMLQYEMPELCGKNMLDIATPDSRGIILEKIQSGSETPYEVTLLRKDGARVDVEMQAKVSTYRGRQVRVAAVRDITHRKLAEAAIRNAEAKFRAIVEQSLVGVYMAREGKLIYANPRFTEITGYPMEELIGIDILDIVVDDDKPIVMENIRKRMSGEVDKVNYTFRGKRKDGDIVHLETYGSISVIDGQPTIIGMMNDITSRVEFENELRHAKDRAEDATKIKDKFVSLVAHDLKSPFGSMLGLLKLLRSEIEINDIQEKVRYLDAIIDNAEHMTRLIDELLKISRLQTGKITPSRKFIDASATASAVIKALQFMTMEKKIKIENKIQPGSRIYADEVLLFEVVQNLVSNAIKFSPKGGEISIYIPDSERTTIAVKDNGVGISNKIIADIFKHEIKTSTLGTSGEKGTGLGLPYSHDIMESHGGELAVRSKQGEGSVFYVRLPYAKPIVLVVDDEEFMRLVLKSYLEQIDVDVIEAEEGHSAIATMQNVTPHLILVDLMMPGMNGFDLLKHVRSNPKTEFIPVVVATSNSEMASRDKAFRLGASDFINKPVAMHDFLPRIKRFIV